MASEDGLINKVASGFLRFVRLYTYNTPIRKGGSRLMQAALTIASSRAEKLTAVARDGRRFAVDLTTGMEETVFFFGEYEPFITQLVESLVAEGDVCVDAGANFGWYTTLMANLTGSLGTVHAFEPVPASFDALRRNVELLQNEPSIELSRLALTDSESASSITVFDGQPTGHASLVADGVSGTAVSCETIRLDQYLKRRSVDHIDFLKVDVEGAELSLLRGGVSLLEQMVPPVIVMEMALGTSTRFGYIPNDLIEFIGSRAEYNFYKIDELRRRLIPIDGFSRDDIGANVLCIPVRAAERIRAVVDRFLN